MNAVYPRLYRLDEAKSDWGEENEGHLVMPDRLPCSGAALTHDGVFLLACDEACGLRRGVMCRLFVVVGKTVTAELCGRLFGVATVVNSVHGASLSLLQSEDLLVQRVWRVVERVKEELGEELQVRIVVRGEKEMNEVSLLLRDDRIRLDGSLSEFVCEFFKRVLAKYKWCVCCIPILCIPNHKVTSTNTPQSQLHHRSVAAARQQVLRLRAEHRRVIALHRLRMLERLLPRLRAPHLQRLSRSAQVGSRVVEAHRIHRGAHRQVLQTAAVAQVPHLHHLVLRAARHVVPVLAERQPAHGARVLRQRHRHLLASHVPHLHRAARRTHAQQQSVGVELNRLGRGVYDSHTLTAHTLQTARHRLHGARRGDVVEAPRAVAAAAAEELAYGLQRHARDLRTVLFEHRGPLLCRQPSRPHSRSTHRRTVLSSEPEITTSRVGCSTTEFTAFLCPVKLRRTLRSATLYRST